VTRLLAALTALGAALLLGAASASAGVIVQWAPSSDRAERIAANAEAEVEFDQTLGQPLLHSLEPDAGQSVGDAVAALRTDDAVLVAEPDRLNFPHAVPDDEFFDELWGLRNLGGDFGIEDFAGPVAGADIAAVDAWDRTVGIPSVVVAVIDSGYRFNHPDLSGVAWNNSDETAGNSIDDDGNGRVDDTRGFDFVGQNSDTPVSDNDPSDTDLITGGHGVHVAGTVGAEGDDGAGITGVAQNVRIMPLRVCANDGSETNPPKSSCPDSSLIQAIDYAGENGADVANLSLGRAGSPSQLTIDAFARHPGTLYVISAGNDGTNHDGGGDPPNGHHYPCDYNPDIDSAVVGGIDNIVCVAASDQADEIAGFSDYGASSVDLAAPGTETLSAHQAIASRYAESFTVNDFATKWSATAANGFGRDDDGPLTSFGMTDSPGGAPAVSATYQSTLTTGFTVPAGWGSCRLSAQRFLELGSGSFQYSVLSNDVAVFTSSPASTPGDAMALFFTQQISGLAGTTVKLRFRYIADSTPSAAEGAWLDDLEFRCFEPATSSTASYAYLQGTSMAAPHVAGAAALLVSLDPSATVPELRSALMDGAVPNRSSLCDPVTELDNRRTVTGGRLNVDRSMDVLMGDPLAPLIPSTCGPAPPAEEPGTGQLPVTVDGGRVIAPPPVRCKVPKLKGLSPRKAKAALKKANCVPGMVTMPKKKPGQRKLPALIVRSSKPKAGTEHDAGKKVAVTLGPKPKKRRKRR
jgi:subtilisin family serine protease